jgi:DNA end-binding protein Ku
VIGLLETKRKGKPNIVRPVSAPGLPIDLMVALKRSLESSLPPANDLEPVAKASKPKKAKPRVEGQREMLLPIFGGKSAAEPAKRETKTAPKHRAG